MKAPITEEQAKKNRKIAKRILIVFGSFFLLLILIVSTSPEPEEPPKTPEQIAADSVKARRDLLVKNGVFSDYSGQSVAMITAVSTLMNDPNSFEHLQTKYIDKGGDSIVLIMEYTGKNAFGGRVRGKAVGIVSATDGSLIELLSNE